MKKLFYLLTITMLIRSNSSAQPMYSNTSVNVFYSPAHISAQTGLPIIYLDDVNIPSSLMGSTDSLDVTRITFGFAKYGRQIPLWVDFYYSTVNMHAGNLAHICNFPPVHFDSLFAYGRNMFGILYKTFGDSVHTLFRVRTTKDSIKKGYNTFFVGMSFSINSDSAMGYVHGPLYTLNGTAQKNLAATWYYDGVKGGKINKVNNNPGAFYLVIWAKPAGSTMRPVPMVFNSHLNASAIKDEIKWSVYPNPVKSNTQLQLQLLQSRHVKIEVYSQVGVLELSLDKHTLPAGFSNISLDLSSLNAGLHLLKLYADDKAYGKIIYK